MFLHNEPDRIEKEHQEAISQWSDFLRGESTDKNLQAPQDSVLSCLAAFVQSTEPPAWRPLFIWLGWEGSEPSNHWRTLLDIPWGDRTPYGIYPAKAYAAVVFLRVLKAIAIAHGKPVPFADDAPETKALDEIIAGFTKKTHFPNVVWEGYFFILRDIQRKVTVTPADCDVPALKVSPCGDASTCTTCKSDPPCQWLKPSADIVLNANPDTEFWRQVCTKTTAVLQTRYAAMEWAMPALWTVTKHLSATSGKFRALRATVAPALQPDDMGLKKFEAIQLNRTHIYGCRAKPVFRLPGLIAALALDSAVRLQGLSQLKNLLPSLKDHAHE